MERKKLENLWSEFPVFGKCLSKTIIAVFLIFFFTNVIHISYHHSFSELLADSFVTSRF